MSLRINNNVESLNAHRHLINNDKQLSKSIERLSSGQKINRGADGPASLVISEGMRAQIGSIQQATDNNEAAISLVRMLWKRLIAYQTILSLVARTYWTGVILMRRAIH